MPIVSELIKVICIGTKGYEIGKNKNKIESKAEYIVLTRNKEEER